MRAQEEARELHHGHIGSEHLLIALLDPEVASAEALNTLGTSADEIRSRVLAKFEKGAAPPSGHVPFTSNAKAILEQSLRISLRLHQKSIGPEHLLIAVLENRKCAGHKILGFSSKEAGQLVDSLSELATLQPEYAPSDDYPMCRRCQRPLAETLGHRTLTSHDDEATPAPVTLVFCRSCGTTIGVIADPGTVSSAPTS